MKLFIKMAVEGWQWIGYICLRPKLCKVVVSFERSVKYSTFLISLATYRQWLYMPDFSPLLCSSLRFSAVFAVVLWLFPLRLTYWDCFCMVFYLLRSKKRKTTVGFTITVVYFSPSDRTAHNPFVRDTSRKSSGTTPVTLYHKVSYII
jgi:hypothetical protein